MRATRAHPNSADCFPSQKDVQGKWQEFVGLQTEYLHLTNQGEEAAKGYFDGIFRYIYKLNNSDKYNYLERRILDLVQAIENELNKDAFEEKAIESPSGKSVNEEINWFVAKKGENKKLKAFFEGAKVRCASDKTSAIYNDLILKMSSCADMVLFRSIAGNENYKKGTRFCKCKTCAICQAVISSNRKNAVLSYINDHAEDFENDYFYHGVFNVQHDANTRNYDYSSELIAGIREVMNKSKRVLVSVEFARWLKDQGFTKQAKRLPKNVKEKYGNVKDRFLSRRDIWKFVVSGGMYSIEATMGKNDDPSLHIHSHMMLLSRFDFGKSREETTIHPFIKYVRETWNKFHGMKKGQQSATFERAYKKDGVVKRYIESGDVDGMSNALAELVKYTFKLDIKADDEKANTFNVEALASMLDAKNKSRYFNLFGCLRGHGVTMYSADDLDKVELSGKAIIDHKGNEYTSIEAPLRISPFYNNQPSKNIDGAYVFIDKRKTKIVDEENAGKVLSMSPEFLFNQQIIERAEREIRAKSDIEENTKLILKIQKRQNKIPIGGGSQLAKWQTNVYHGANEKLKELGEFLFDIIGRVNENPAWGKLNSSKKEVDSIRESISSLRMLNKRGLCKGMELHIMDELELKYPVLMGSESLVHTLEVNEQQGISKGDKMASQKQGIGLVSCSNSPSISPNENDSLISASLSKSIDSYKRIGVLQLHESKKLARLEKELTRITKSR